MDNPLWNLDFQRAAERGRYEAAQPGPSRIQTRATDAELRRQADLVDAEERARVERGLGGGGVGEGVGVVDGGVEVGGGVAGGLENAVAADVEVRSERSARLAEPRGNLEGGSLGIHSTPVGGEGLRREEGSGVRGGPDNLFNQHYSTSYNAVFPQSTPID